MNFLIGVFCHLRLHITRINKINANISSGSISHTYSLFHNTRPPAFRMFRTFVCCTRTLSTSQSVSLSLLPTVLRNCALNRKSINFAAIRAPTAEIKCYQYRSLIRLSLSLACSFWLMFARPNTKLLLV